MRSDSSIGRRLSEQLSFRQLAEARRQLREDVLRHRDCINYFANPRGFERTADDVAASGAAFVLPAIAILKEKDRPSGITTAMTCFESLAEAGPPDEAQGGGASLATEDLARLNSFVHNAARHTQYWRSEGAARRYCIVRAIPPMVGLSNTVGHKKALSALVKEVWANVDFQPDTAGIHEVSERPGTAAEQIAPPENDPRYRYPPNAFLTYWGIRSLRCFPALEKSHSKKIGLVETWLLSAIGRELGLHYHGSRNRDPQQLAWAICGLAAIRDDRLGDRGGDTRELVEAALKAFFEQQLDDGSWDRGTALFHYPEAGNAYCYQYETLSELVNLAHSANPELSDEFRGLLEPYIPNLLAARDHLMKTARSLGEPGLVGWSSGHHPHRTSPESWATATAFRFLHATRKLLGMQVRDIAASELRARSAAGGLDLLAERGKTWDTGIGSTGDLLASLFVHPQGDGLSQSRRTDPDIPLLKKSWARSAILYGPPGTGKTTLATSVAAALDWQFVEITAAQFLDQGTQRVSSRADEIFDQLMELDRAVVLFDEIDELVQVRDGAADMLGRFFTTTMLPRLAKLWDSRKVIFFVNTNSISRVDPAIKRSQRFDAAALVLPPSYKTKLEILGYKPEGLPSIEIMDGLINGTGDSTSQQTRLAVFSLLRYDQVVALAEIRPDDKEALLAQLDLFARDLARSDWRGAVEGASSNGNSDQEVKKPNGGGEQEIAELLFEAVRYELEYERVDSGRDRIVIDKDGARQDWNSVDETKLDGAGRIK